MKIDARLWLRTETADMPGMTTLQFRTEGQPGNPQINVTVTNADAADLEVGAMYRFEPVKISGPSA